MTGSPNRLAPPAGRFQHDLNGGSTCFLCLSQSTSPEKFSLRSIYRYLKINFKNVLLGCFNVGDADKENAVVNQLLKQLSSDFQTVVLCNQCTPILAPLSNLCIQLEFLQMRVQHHLQSVNGILKCSQTTEQSPNYCQPNTTSDIDWQFTKSMRKKVHQKCQMKLSQAVPKVVLTNDSSLLLTHKIGNMKTPPEMQNGKNCLSRTSTSLAASDDDTGDAQSDNEISQEKITPNDFESNSGETNRSRYRTCNLCHPPRLVHTKVANQHEAVNHFDNWLIPSKQSNVNQKEFKEYCFHVLRVELLSCVPLFSDKRNELARCPHCPFTASTADKMYKLRRHIFTIHKKIVAQKLVQLQQSTSLDEIRAFKIPPGVNFRLPEMDGKRNAQRQKKHECDMCDKKFISVTNLVKHKRMEHDNFFPEQGIWKCEHCGMEFKQSSKFRKHVKVDHETKLFTYKCSDCGKKFQFGSQVQRHRRMVHGMDQCVHKCDLCGAEFKNTTNLWSHRKIEHGESIPRCAICDKEFLSHRILLKHKETKCVPLFKCNICTREFRHLSTLSKHKKHHKSNGPMQKCDICGKPFQRKDNILQHKRRVHGIGVFGTRCDHCGKTFKDSRRLLRHIQTAHERKHVPEIKKLKSSKNSNADGLPISIQSQQLKHPVVVSKVEILDDNQVDRVIDFDDNDMGCSVSEEHETEFHLEEESTNANNSDELEDHSAVPVVEMKILPEN